jgi:hypothetical protein
MQSLTLLIAVSASALVLLLSPVGRVIVLLTTLAWYPSYLTVKVGTLDFSVSRIVVITIFLAILLGQGRPTNFKFTQLDKFVIAYFICEIIAGLTTMPASVFLENRAGAFLSTVLPYFAVRLAITTKKQYYTVLKAIVIIAAPLAIIGLYESVTGNNPFGFLRQYHAWRVISEDFGQAPRETRMGLYRAVVTFPQPIMFGLFFAMFAPPCAALFRVVPRNKFLWWIGVAFMALGAVSSVSSGPVLSLVLAAVFIACYRWRKYWKVAVVLLLLMVVCVEIVSNRHFYDVIGRFTFSAGTAWYRSKLMEVALGGGMSGHWLTGFGFADPGWSYRIDHRSHTDIVNHYLLVLARYGLVGFIPFVGVILTAMKNLIVASRQARLDADKWTIWTLGATLCGLLFAFFSVSLGGQTPTFFYMILGFCGVMPTIMSEPAFNTVQFVARKNHVSQGRPLLCP